MHNTKFAIRHLAFLSGSLAIAGSALATQGTFPHGYGVKAEGMGGASIALPQDALAGANNPAGMLLVGARADIGGAFLQVDNGAKFAGTTYDGASEKSLYIIPQMGFNYLLGADTSLGLSVVGNGVGTAYGSQNVGGMQSPKSELKQMVGTLSLAHRIAPGHSLGLGLVLASQRLAINGTASLGLPDGHDSSYGAGLSLGWVGELAPGLNLGATYASKVRMGKLDQFKGLLADGGRMDIPEHYGAGFAYRFGNTTIAGDLKRINWNDVDSLGNAGVGTASGAPGTANGPGFGWRNQTVWRIGVSHQLNEQWTLRAGYSDGTQILNARDTYLGILAPAANHAHATLGATWALSKGSELSLAYARAFKDEVQGNGPGPNAATSLYMGQNWLSLSYGMSF